MIIFRIIFNLIRIIIHLAVRVLWLPIHLLTHHLFGFLLIVGAILLLAYCHHIEVQKAPSQLPKAPPPSVTVAPQLQGAQVQPKKGIATRIDPVMKYEDGDSAFASDLYGAMSDAERAYYSQLFYWVMNTMKDNQPYSWANMNINGTVTPIQTFQNRVGQTCRNFKEVLKVHTVQQELTGIACDNGNTTWCKLKTNATPMCGLGYEPSTWDSIKRSWDNLF